MSKKFTPPQLKSLQFWKVPEAGVLTCPAVSSEIGDFCHVHLRKFSNGLPSSADDGSYLISDRSFRLTPSENQPIEVSSPATRPRLSHRKLHVGEYRMFRCKISPLDPFGIVLSLAATQQADPILRHTTTLSSNINPSTITHILQTSNSAKNPNIITLQENQKQKQKTINIIIDKITIILEMSNP